ncbi:Relaxase/Mobilisation nuclease domain-containing protein [Loktanella atrilutea]|uniref:Relaxase/Mobilisation nuclease domain-containing protein n=1 Tax=Loktanella atrilutea TaxID=366533 RepID=A0A1M5EBL7_LOKAT|nr:relaxase/mobilization nuclease domain-containing protein [Loktanella atrilutea]SHF76629.1 Relaxase/Mobilisation nuclease domain-containing protein [Loktanella atrilutea]
MSAAGFYDEILIRANRGMGRTAVGGGAKPRAERIWKSLTSGGSAFVKRIPGAGVQHPTQLAGQLAYVNGKAKAIFGFATDVCGEGDAFAQADLDKMMEAWAQDWHGRPRNGHTSHMVLSFPDDVSQESAVLIAQEWCAEMFESEIHVADTWEYVAALHTDTANPHVHVVLNNRGAGGAWFSISTAGVFNPQMMRDRMTDIADDYGVRLESLSRADRGLYRDPIGSAAVFAAREGRRLRGADVVEDLAVDWRREDMQRTATLYTVLADFAETIGAPMIASRAKLSAAALFAGKDVPKGQDMDIDLDVTADRADIRVSLIGWAEQNSDALDALPEETRRQVMTKIDAALTLIETDGTEDLSQDSIWAGFGVAPSSYLIPDMDKLEARAALYAGPDKTDLLRAFVGGQAFDAYLVTGEVAPRFAPILPVVAEAYAEMHSHDLAEIPRAMTAYIDTSAALGLDPGDIAQRLIARLDDPKISAQRERGDITRIVTHRGSDLSDTAAVATAAEDYRDFQLGLAEVEETLIAASRVYSRAGVAQILEDAAHTAASTGRADLADSATGRQVLTAFVALEGRGAMQEIASGNRDPLAAYLTTPASQRLAARELLKSAKSLDVGLELDEIETGLEAVDPTYSRGLGYSI